MKATATNVLKLLQGSKVFLIPTFQRRYTWKKEQWSQFWDDLYNECTTAHQDDPETLQGHFLGSVVLHPALGPASTLMRHQVIDGQQRLTTILILLAALRDVRQIADPNWNPDAIDSQYLQNAFSSEYPHRLVPTKLDRRAYVSTVHEGVPTGDIGIAYNHFKEEIEKVQASGEVELSRLEDTLLLHMLLVEITTKTGDPINSIFNTLNSKGMDLSPADLVRNEILHHVGAVDADDAHDEYWIPMEEALVNPKAKARDREFVTFLWSREVALNPKTSRDDLFHTFERRFRSSLSQSRDSRASALAQLQEMFNDHLLFLMVREPQRGVNDKRVSKPLLAALQALKDWRSEPVTPIALWVLKQAVTNEELQDDAADALWILLSYLVKRVLHGIPTNQLNRLLTPVAFELANRGNRTIAETMTLVLSRQGYYWPTDAQVLSSVDTVPLYASARRYTKFLLATAEEGLPGRETADLTKSQIEHIMPQSLSPEWKAELGEAGVDLQDAEALVHTIGNLTLTDNNQKMGNSAFSVKRAEFFDVSALRLNRTLANQGQFLPEDIRLRSVALAEIILSKFHHEPISTRVDSLVDGSSIAERLRSLLKSLPVGRWVSEEDLVAVLGATSSELRRIVNTLDPTLARLIRADQGQIPAWLSDDLQAAVLIQDEAQGPAGRAMSTNELNDLSVRANESIDEAAEFDDEEDEAGQD